MYEAINSNIRKTYFYIFLVFCLLIGVGWFFSWYLGDSTILIWAVFFALFYNLIAYFYSDQIVLTINRAREITKKDAPDFFRLVENLSIRSGLPMPHLYIIDDPSPNAFATGRDPKNASIAVTSGLLETMDKAELNAVLAHEMSHIKNYDIRLQTVIAVLAGAIVILINFLSRIWIFGDRDNRQNNLIALIGFLIIIILAPILGQLIQLAISRRRELLADATSVDFTRYPQGLVGALEKINNFKKPMQNTDYATAHLFFASPMHSDATDKENVGFMAQLFMTHPPISERIKALEKMHF